MRGRDEMDGQPERARMDTIRVNGAELGRGDVDGQAREGEECGQRLSQFVKRGGDAYAKA